MTTLFVIAPSKTEFNHKVDEWTRHQDYSGERFAYVAGPHSLYGVNLTPDRVIFVEGWSNRPDAKDLIAQLEQRMAVHPSVKAST